jgi:hypothetical protein
MNFKSLLLALAVTLMAFPAIAQTHVGPNYKRTGNWVVGSGGQLNAESGSTVTLAGTTNLGGTLNTSAATFSTATTGNPLVQSNLRDLTEFSSTAMTVLIASAAGKSIYPLGGLSIMASGTAATATAIALECSDGTLIASFPIAGLIHNVPVSPFSSTGAIVTGPGLTKGCAAGTAVMLSNVGTVITTTTHLYVNTPYVVQ